MNFKHSPNLPAAAV